MLIVSLNQSTLTLLIFTMIHNQNVADVALYHYYQTYSVRTKPSSVLN